MNHKFALEPVRTVFRELPLVDRSCPHFTRFHAARVSPHLLRIARQPSRPPDNSRSSIFHPVFRPVVREPRGYRRPARCSRLLLPPRRTLVLVGGLVMLARVGEVADRDPMGGGEGEGGGALTLDSRAPGAHNASRFVHSQGVRQGELGQMGQGVFWSAKGSPRCDNRQRDGGCHG